MTDTTPTPAPSSDVCNTATVQPSQSGEYMDVYCCLPNGLTLELIPKIPEVHTPAGPAPVISRMPPGPRVVLQGSNSRNPVITLGDVNVRTAQSRHIFGRTRVERSFWEAWLAHGDNRNFVTKGLVFAIAVLARETGNDANATDVRKERDGEVRTGLEALNTQNDAKGRPLDPRMRSARVPGSSDLTVDAEHLTRLQEQMREAVY